VVRRTGVREPPVIEVRDVTKTFRIPHVGRTALRDYVVHPLRRTTWERNDALKNVSFSIDRGEFFGVIGPNGSGKSTLLRILAGIYRVDEGEVAVRGAVSSFIELGVGFNPELSARDNIVINGTLLGLTRPEIDERFDQIVAFAELERFVDQKLKNYSSGMRIRLAFSIAIQVPFDVLLLDEVLAVGDQAFQEKCLETFAAMKQSGKTIVLVTHSMGWIRHFGDRVLLLDNGVARRIGPPNEIIDLYGRRLAVA
jgi:ABC-type polysaccharide/polyol phosphate transport system ATPase subunit